MSTLTPLRVVQLYNDELWNNRKRELIPQLVAAQIRRHHPGGTQVLSNDDMLTRYDTYMKRFPKLNGIVRQYICDGPFVTTIWDLHTEARGGQVATVSGIEIFKVVDGKITDVWNPNGIGEHFAAGPWPDFER